MRKPERLTEPDPPRQHMIGYARVSMRDQDNRRQRDDMIRFGVAEADIYEDKASGRTMKRPGWEACWKDLREGDLLVVHAIDRLGRDLVQVVQTIRDLHAKGADIKVLSMDLDTRSPMGRLVFSIMAAMAQWERELIVERTRSGLAAARARGRIGGRKAAITPQQVREAAARVRKGEEVADIAAGFGISRQALYKHLNKLKQQRAAMRAAKEVK